MKEYEEKVKIEIEEYETKRKEIMEEYAEKMKAAADEMELPEHPCKKHENLTSGLGYYYPCSSLHDLADNHTLMHDYPDYPAVEGQDFGYPPFFYPPITHFPVNTLEEDAAAEGEEGKGKTISLPVFYNSYFPRWR